MRDHLEIAVYGKGGIGKSTVSANMTAATAMKGLNVLQIGCDPKHDSTRLLMHGTSIPTVLDVLRDKGAENAQPEDILKKSEISLADSEIGCIEAGGPKPGVGCAGRGIISAFEYLGKHHILEQYDRVLYDVLGDVVCGGFAVPVRREYADAVFLVTSGEYMALYAANNILRGIRNFDGDKYKRIAGIIYNERKLEDEDERVRRFADAVGLPVLVKVPRSEVFARAEEENCTVMELDGAEREKNVFNTLADLLINGMTLYPANPLSDEDHERIVLGKGEKSVPKAAEADGKPSGAADADELPCEAAFPETEKSYTNRRPLYGCAFNGAASFAVHLTDAIVIAHGPKACAFYTMQTISSPGKRNIFNRGVLLPSSISPNFVSTDISHSEAVFGGMDLLKDAVKIAMEQKPGAVIVVSTCVAGIIGDDLKAVEEMSTDDIPVIAITADGDMNGDYMEGLRMAQEIIVSRLADRNVPKEDKCVNIIGEAGIVTNKGSNFAVMERLLKGMGIRVNCRFLGDATAQEVKGLCKARLNILAAESADAYQLKEYLVKEFGCEFLEEPLPIGFEATKNWVMAIGRFFGCEEEAAKIVEAERKDYEERVANLKKHLEGKKIFLTTINTNIDWLLDTAFDAGMTFAHIGVYNYLRTPLNVTKHPERMNIVEETLDAGKTRQLIKELDPDIILSAYASGNSDDHAVIDVLPMVPDLGVMSAVLIMERWIRLMQTKRKGEWERDRVLFEKYFQ